MNRALSPALAASLWLVSGATLGATAPAAAPDVRAAALNGVWQLSQPLGKELRDSKGAAPPLNAAGKKLYQQRRALLAKADTSYDLANFKCKPMGFPRVLWDGGPFDLQIQRGLVFFGYTFNRNHRTALWGEGLPALQIPRYYGTSAARWDGDTLVVASGLFVDNTILDSAGLPHSEDMVLTERYQPHNAGKQLEVQLTISDPLYYRKAWQVRVRFDRVLNGRILEDVCQERSSFYRPLLGLK